MDAVRAGVVGTNPSAPVCQRRWRLEIMSQQRRAALTRSAARRAAVEALRLRLRELVDAAPGVDLPALREATGLGASQLRAHLRAIGVEAPSRAEICRRARAVKAAGKAEREEG